MPAFARWNVSPSNSGRGCIRVSNSWKPSGRLPRMLSRRLTLQGDCFSKNIRGKTVAGAGGRNKSEIRRPKSETKFQVGNEKARTRASALIKLEIEAL